MVPPTVDTGDESVVAMAGFFWSSFRRCSCHHLKAEVSATETSWTTVCTHAIIYYYGYTSDEWKDDDSIAESKTPTWCAGHVSCQQLKETDELATCVTVAVDLPLALWGELALLPVPLAFPSRPLWWRICRCWPGRRQHWRGCLPWIQGQHSSKQRKRFSTTFTYSNIS